MVRIAVLACLLLAVLAPAAAAAGRAGTARAMAAQMRWAGPFSGALAVDLGSGHTIYRLRAHARRMPASVQKLYTSVGALRMLGAPARLSTSVLAERAQGDDGVVEGDLYLRGGGDPTFDVFDSRRLAQQVADAGIVTVRGRVRGDESAFDDQRGVPSSGFALTGDVGPLSALTFNRGRTGRGYPYWQRRPARFAAIAFTKQLRAAGVAVRGRASTGVTPPDAELVTEWYSPSVSDLVRLMNPPSDNFMAETLIKVLGARSGAGGSTAAGAEAVRAALARIGARPQVIDGSGLSRYDRTSPREVVTVLEEMAGDPSFTGSLAIAGRTGTLEDRMRRTSAQDRCRAKTGTLRDVSALAGYCTTRDGGTVAFAFLMNYVNVYGARILQDRMAAALARYSG